MSGPDEMRDRFQRQLGYTHWLQMQFGTEMIRRGIKMSQELQENDENTPHHQPRENRKRMREEMPTPTQLFGAKHSFVSKVLVSCCTETG